MAVDKGPIVDEHVLVLPIEHYASQVSLSPTALAELERFLSALRSCFAAQARTRVPPPSLSRSSMSLLSLPSLSLPRRSERGAMLPPCWHMMCLRCLQDRAAAAVVQGAKRGLHLAAVV